MNRPDLQESIMDKALDGRLKGYTYGTDYAQKLKSDYKTDHDINELTALVHFMGPGNARKYLSDPTGFKVPGKSNASGTTYLDKFKKHFYLEAKKEEGVLRQEADVPDLHDAFKPNYQPEPIPEPQFPKPTDSVTANEFNQGGSIYGINNAEELVTTIENGGSHGQNPNGGVQVGTGSNGLPNLLEEKETIWNDYVFSNNIKL